MLKTGFFTTTLHNDISLRLDHPHAFFRGAGKKNSTNVSVKDDTVTVESEAIYYCSICRHIITTATQMTEVNGQHHHVYANPVGNVFKIGCFNNSPGCISHGTPTTECTWFAGFSWCFSLCGQCHTHLGWKYTSDTHGNFWGLIVNMLICQ